MRAFHQRYALYLFAIGVLWCLAVEWADIGDAAYQLSKDFFSYEWRQHLGMAKRYLWQWLYLPGLFLMLISTGALLGGTPAPNWRSRMRHAAAYTFPVYIAHFSFIYLAQSLVPNYQPTAGSADPYIMMVIAMSITLLFSWMTIQFVQPLADRWIARLYSKGR